MATNIKIVHADADKLQVCIVLAGKVQPAVVDGQNAPESIQNDNMVSNGIENGAVKLFTLDQGRIDFPAFGTGNVAGCTQ